MNKKGFTLAELLGVIVILSLIALVVLPAIDNSLKESKETMYQSQLNTIREAAKTWASDHVEELPSTTNASITVTLADLKTGGYIDQDIKNPKTESLFADTLYVRIRYFENDYEYTVVE